MFALLMTAAALLHPVHETLSEIEWNEQSKVLEVAVRLDVLDEQWLQKRYGREAEFSSWAVRYLRRNFRIDEPPRAEDQDSQRNKVSARNDDSIRKDVSVPHAGQSNDQYRWIGRDEEGSHVWWYFEIEPEDRKMPVWIEQRMLFEREEGFSNRILILGQVPRRSLTLTIGQPKARLDQVQNDSNPTPPPDR